MKDKEDKYDYYADDIKHSAKFPIPTTLFSRYYL